VVFLGSRAGRLGPAGQFSGEAGADASHDLQREGDIPRHPQQHGDCPRHLGRNHQPNRLDPFGFLDLFNLLNANSEQNTNWTSGSTFLWPLDIAAPRIARIGMKLEW
jgi:hypothetical protein